MNKQYQSKPLNKNLTRTLILLVALVILAAVLYGNCTAIVPTGYTGIVTTFGKVSDYTLEAGFHLKSPFQKVTMMDNREQKAAFATMAFSSDIQQVDVSGSVNYSINQSTAMTLFKEVGAGYYNTLILPRLMENMKAVFSKYTAEDLISARELLSQKVRTLISAEMSAYGINIINVSIEDIDFTDAFTDAVEAKQVAQQTKLQAEIEQEQLTMETQQASERKVIEAEAAASVLKINADAEAYSVTVQAEAEAAANKLIAESLTENLIAYSEIERWNGELPNYIAGDGTTTLPILDMNESGIK